MPSDVRIASPWLRDLRSGGARRHDPDGELVAVVAPHARGWKWFVLPESGEFYALTREQAKDCADRALRRDGWQLVDVAGGCAIEKG